MLGSTLLTLSIVLVQSTPAPAPLDKQGQKPHSVDAEVAEKLLQAKRIFVESFGDDGINKTLQAMVIDAFRTSHRFIITENKEKADLILKGAALERTSQELHALGSATAVAGAAGGHSSTISGNAGSISGSSSGGFAARSLGIEDSQASTETISDARMAVRLVSSDGDVVWSTTQESKGAKFKSASADIADKIIKQLLRDIEKLTNKPASEVKE
ncbi:MAG TPA: hypothetical protein VNX18_03645 [Bryobacteraceae bacterium]|jgi:hypothetical protein|nr:hypothetical protein [Bryobacteraceae bacterium]